MTAVEVIEIGTLGGASEIIEVANVSGPTGAQGPQGTPGTSAVTLDPVNVQTATYTAAPGQFVPMDSTAGNVFVMFPATASADRSVIAVRHVTQGGTNTVTCQAQGSDKFNKPGSASTTYVLPLLNQSVVFTYDSTVNVWYPVTQSLGLGGMDLRFAPINRAIPAGGTASQALVKNSATDYDASWATVAGGGGGAPTGAAGGSLAGSYPNPTLAPAAVADLNAFTSALKGLAPASGGGTTAFLRADGTWAVPPGGGGGGTAASTSFNSFGTLAATDVQTAIQELLVETTPIQMPTTVKVSSYTANGSEFVPVDTTTIPVGISLPQNQAKGTQVRVRHLIQGGTNAVTVSAQGLDIMHRPSSGLTSMVLPLLGQEVTFLYDNGPRVWYVIVHTPSASEISSTAVGSVTATNVQTAIQQLDAKVPLASAVTSTPVGEIPSTNVQAALANLDSRTAAAAWIDKLAVAADFYDDFVSQDVIASPGVIGALRWSIPTGVATLPTWQTASGPNGVGVFQLPVTLLDSFASINLTPDILELSPVFTAEWRLGLSALNDGSNNFDVCVGLHNDIPRTVTDLVTTNASPTVTSATASFNILKDIGKTLSTPNVPVGTTIIAVPNATTATLSANATTGSSAQTATMVGGTNGYWFKYSGASANWRACVGDSNLGFITNVDTGVVPSIGAVFQKLRIKCDGGGNVFFYVNGTLVSNMPINTNLPATSRYTPTISVRKALGSTVKRVNVDYFAMHYEKTR